MDQELLKELPIFENFLNRLGFKRIDGAVYGLLIISDHSLTSEEIEEHLGLSQSAISNSLKTLTHFGAVESREHPENKRIKLHTAKDDSLKIASTIFRKREQENVEEFKAMAKRLLKKSEEIDNGSISKRSIRLKSIILTCDVAESVIKFVIGITQLENSEHYKMALQKLPRTLDLLIKGAAPISDFAGQITDTITGTFTNGITEQVKSSFTNKLKDQLSKIKHQSEKL